MFDALATSLPEKSLWVAAIVFLVLMVVGGVLIGRHNRLPARGNARLPIASLDHVPILGKMAILRVELARNEGDLEQVITPGHLEPALVKRNIEDARKGNTLDTYLFIPAYSGLLITIGLFLARGDEKLRSILLLAALVGIPIAAGCDWTENHGITLTLQHFKDSGVPQPGDAVRISRPSLVKWTLTTLVLLIYGISALRRLGTWNWPLAVIGVFGVGLGALLVYTLAQYSLERYGH